MESFIIRSKKLTIFYSLLFFAFNAFSQTSIDSIKNNATQLPIKWSVGNNFSTPFLDTLAQILNTNVIEYFKLEKQFDTELKQKVYLESQEGKKQKTELANKRKLLLNHLLYIELDDYNAKYNPTTKSIEFSVQFYDNGYNYSKPTKHIQVDHLVLNYNLNCTNNKKSELLNNPEDPRDRRIKETIGIKVSNETNALKIEENIKKTEPGKGSNVKYLFLFKVTNTDPVKTRLVYEGKSYLRKEDLIIGQLKTIIIYNRATNEIYNVTK